jgi:hypothetical protein
MNRRILFVMSGVVCLCAVLKRVNQNRMDCGVCVCGITEVSCCGWSRCWMNKIACWW